MAQLANRRHQARQAGGIDLDALAIITGQAVSETGSTPNGVATLNLASTVIFAVTCIAGGWFSDHFGRRRTLAFLSDARMVLEPSRNARLTR